MGQRWFYVVKGGRGRGRRQLDFDVDLKPSIYFTSYGLGVGFMPFSSWLGLGLRLRVILTSVFGLIPTDAHS